LNLQKAEIHLQRCFFSEAKTSHSFFKTYPLLAEAFEKKHFTAEVFGHNIVGLCLWSTFNLLNGNKVANIGGVSVLPEHKGKGIAKQLLKCALKKIQEDGYHEAVLFASNEKLYESVGFKTVAKECMFQPTESNHFNASFSNSNAQEFENFANIPGPLQKQIVEILKHQFESCKILWEEKFENLLCIYNSKIILYTEREMIQAMFIYQKGADFFATAHSVFFTSIEKFAFLFENYRKKQPHAKYILIEPLLQKQSQNLKNFEFNVVSTGTHFMKCIFGTNDSFAASDNFYHFIPALLAS
jgi:N-acetylglutamate synthase-like GNAT family acetyltransferase